MTSETAGAGAPTPPSQGQHLATISHEGRFWDVYLEFADDPRRPNSFRAALCYVASDVDTGEGTSLRTAEIIIEPSYEEALTRARAMEEHQLQALLRSCLPD